MYHVPLQLEKEIAFFATPSIGFGVSASERPRFDPGIQSMGVFVDFKLKCCKFADSLIKYILAVVILPSRSTGVSDRIHQCACSVMSVVT
jgi:hypothetical protein